MKFANTAVYVMQAMTFLLCLCLLYFLFIQPEPIAYTRLIGGPLAVYSNGERYLGGPKAAFAPEEYFGYQRQICMRRNSDIQIQRRLLHLQDERVYTFATGHIPANVFGNIGCWTDTEIFKIPSEAQPGTYHMQNIAAATVWPFRRQEIWMEPIVIEVKSAAPSGHSIYRSRSPSSPPAFARAP